jgi:predicted DNA-binding transcriptional regulator
MQDRLAKELENIGFSDKESRVYLAALELGPATAQQVAAKATVNRPTTYVAIESLIKRGLMSSIQKGKKRFFVAEPPENLSSIFKQQRNELEQREERMKEIMGDLRILALGSEARPQVVFYEGSEGVERMRQTLRECKVKDVHTFYMADYAFDEFPRSDGDHRDWFRKNKKIQAIYSSKNGPILEGVDDGVERRFIPYDEYPFQSEISINGPIVSIVHYTPLVGIQVFHEGIARTLRRLFLLAWKSLEKNKA